MLFFAVIRLCRHACAGKSPYFIGTFGFSCATESTYDAFLRNKVDLRRRGFFGQKRLKTPEKAPKSLIFARRCRAKWSAWRLNVATLIPATKSGVAYLSQTSLNQPDFCVVKGDWRYLIAFLLKSAHRAFLGLTRGIYGRKEEGAYRILFPLISMLNCDYHLTYYLCFNKGFGSNHLGFLFDWSSTNSPKLEGGCIKTATNKRRCRLL